MKSIQKTVSEIHEILKEKEVPKIFNEKRLSVEDLNIYSVEVIKSQLANDPSYKEFVDSEYADEVSKLINDLMKKTLTIETKIMKDENISFNGNFLLSIIKLLVNQEISSIQNETLIIEEMSDKISELIQKSGVPEEQVDALLDRIFVDKINLSEGINEEEILNKVKDAINNR